MAKTTKKPCRRCWVPTCRNAKPKEAAKKKLFLFPRDVSRCREWVKAIGDITLAETELKKLNTIRFVCEDHFPPAKITPQTRPAADAVPILFEPRRSPLAEEDLHVFDTHVQLDDEIPEPHIDFTQSVNQDSCMSGSSSELSRSSFDVPTHSTDCGYSFDPGVSDGDSLDPLQSDPPSDFPWTETCLPSFDSCEVDLCDAITDHSFGWSYNDSVICDSDRFTTTPVPSSHADFSIMQM